MTNDKAINEFLAYKTKIDAKIAQLKALSDEFFEASPEDLDWQDVGDLERINTLLTQACSVAFGDLA